jgi:hypothetical protein
MAVHRGGAIEEPAEALGTDADGDRQPDRRPQRIAPPDPVPEAEDAALLDAELRAALTFDETAAMCRPGSSTAPASQSRALRALVMVSSVVNVFEATMTRVRAGSRLRVTSARCAPSTLETK